MGNKFNPFRHREFDPTGMRGRVFGGGRGREAGDGEFKDLFNRAFPQEGGEGGDGGGGDRFDEFLDELMASARQARAFGEELFTGTRPLRTETIDTLTRVLRGERPANFRVFAPERQALESQFAQAREQVISGTPTRGGQLNEQLRDVATARALGLATQETDIRKQAFAQALSTGFGITPTAIGGVTSAGGLFGAGGALAEQEREGLRQAFAAERSRGLQALALLGALLGGSAGRFGSAEQAKKANLTSIAGAGAGAFGGCWVAAVLYGWGSREWAAARRWMQADPWRWQLYRCWGPAVAWIAARSGRLRWALRPRFDRAVVRGWEEAGR